MIFFNKKTILEGVNFFLVFSLGQTHDDDDDDDDGDDAHTS